MQKIKLLGDGDPAAGIRAVCGGEMTCYHSKTQQREEPVNLWRAAVVQGQASRRPLALTSAPLHGENPSSDGNNL